jgi:catechol 2,3-dioxygenase-like lactoylglutathione lyase family enzyme
LHPQVIPRGFAMAGWHQIFFYDPDGNVIEVHQAPPSQ